MAQYIFYPNNGTRYNIITVEDPNGGLLVVWADGNQTYRYYAGDYLKFLHGKANTFDRDVIFEYLENRVFCTSYQCERVVMTGGIHPSGLCNICYQSHKQDLRNGTQNIL